MQSRYAYLHAHVKTVLYYFSSAKWPVLSHSVNVVTVYDRVQFGCVGKIELDYLTFYN